MNNELVINETINKIMAIEDKLKEIKVLETQQKSLKEELKKLMEEYQVKKWETPNGIKIALIEDTPDSWESVTKYNEVKFAQENPEFHRQWMELHEKYKETITEIKKGKKGYVRITMPKEEE